MAVCFQGGEGGGGKAGGLFCKFVRVAGEVHVQAGEATQGIVAAMVWLAALCDVSYVALVWPERRQRIS